MKNIKISRSYSAKIQLKQYEPIESFCAAEAEVEEAEMELASASLDKFVQEEVEKTLRGIPLSEPTLEENTPIPIFHPKKENLTPDQYGYEGGRIKERAKLMEEYSKTDITPSLKELQKATKEKKIDLRGEPVCRVCGGTESNLRKLIKGQHEDCRTRESFKLKDL